MMTNELTRDRCREIWAESGLSYSDLTRKLLQELRNLINKEMVSGTYFTNTYRCRQRPTLSNSGQFFASVRCRAFYFDDREAVSFNPDGFIGFAGWADDTNIKPILKGFCLWLEKARK